MKNSKKENTRNAKNAKTENMKYAKKKENILSRAIRLYSATTLNVEQAVRDLYLKFGNI